MAAAKAPVTLEGSGYTPGERVRITFRFAGGGYEAGLRDVTVGPDGRFAAEVKVPVERPTGMETPVFRAHGLDNVDTDNQADTPFTYAEQPERLGSGALPPRPGGTFVHAPWDEERTVAATSGCRASAKAGRSKAASSEPE